MFGYGPPVKCVVCRRRIPKSKTKPFGAGRGCVRGVKKNRNQCQGHQQENTDMELEKAQAATQVNFDSAFQHDRINTMFVASHGNNSDSKTHTTDVETQTNLYTEPVKVDATCSTTEDLQLCSSCDNVSLLPFEIVKKEVEEEYIITTEEEWKETIKVEPLPLLDEEELPDECSQELLHTKCEVEETIPIMETLSDGYEDKNDPLSLEKCPDDFIATRGCSKVFVNGTHSGEKPYSCDLCNKSYTRANDLRRHQMTHSGKKSFSCAVCSKSYFYQRNLVEHQKIHNNEKPFVCDVCNKSFIRRRDFVKHLKSHGEEKRYPCDICQKSLATPYILIEHLRTHSGERPYSCDLCERSYCSRSNLLKHQKNYHSGEMSFPATCDQSFSLTWKH